MQSIFKKMYGLDSLAAAPRLAVALQDSSPSLAPMKPGAAPAEPRHASWLTITPVNLRSSIATGAVCSMMMGTEELDQQKLVRHCRKDVHSRCYSTPVMVAIIWAILWRGIIQAPCSSCNSKTSKARSPSWMKCSQIQQSICGICPSELQMVLKMVLIVMISGAMRSHQHESIVTNMIKQQLAFFHDHEESCRLECRRHE